MKPFFLTALLTLSALDVQGAPMVRVVVGKASQAANTSLAPGSRLTTATKSRSEVELERGVIRTGANTSLQTTADGTMSLERGLALVASQPKFFRPKVELQTPRHRLSVKGTAQVCVEPDGTMRVVVLEGRLSIAMQALGGGSVTLRTGQILVVRPVEDSLPEPLDIDLQRLVSTASLIAEQRFEALPSRSLVVEAVNEQLQSQQDESSSPSTRNSRSADQELTGGRVAELIQSELADEIPDLDGDGDPDNDLEDLDDLDPDDLDEEDDVDDPDEATDDATDTDDGEPDDEPDTDPGPEE
jgi:hypothetical protein